MRKASTKHTTRNIRFRLYPNKGQERVLIGWLGLHCELYNAGLQERREAWKKAGISISYYDQQDVLPQIKDDRPELKAMGSHALQETLRRLERAFQAFYRRIKAGQKPGFPRFKSRRRFDSFCYPDPAGWKLLEHKKNRGKIRVGHLGTLKIRGKARFAFEDGKPRTLTIRRKAGKWYAIIGLRLEPPVVARKPAPLQSQVGLDLGCKALVMTSEGQSFPHPRFLLKAEAKLKKVQRNLAKKKRGSSNRYKTRVDLRRCHEKVVQSRHDFLHKLSTTLVSMHDFIALEALDLKNLTRSAKGSLDHPGKHVKQKAGLNRSLLDASLGKLVQMLVYKAEEAGGHVEAVPPHGTSQQCSRCGKRVEKDLGVRTHDCPHCGLVLDRDHNAAINILSLGLSQAGREPAEVWRGSSPMKHETASIPDQLCLV